MQKEMPENQTQATKDPMEAYLDAWKKMQDLNTALIAAKTEVIRHAVHINEGPQSGTVVDLARTLEMMGEYHG